MRHTSFTCDSCHQPIDDTSDLFLVSVQRFGATGHQRHADFCASCVDTLPPAIRPGDAG